MILIFFLISIVGGFIVSFGTQLISSVDEARSKPGGSYGFGASLGILGSVIVSGWITIPICILGGFVGWIIYCTVNPSTIKTEPVSTNFPEMKTIEEPKLVPAQVTIEPKPTGKKTLCPFCGTAHPTDFGNCDNCGGVLASK